MTDYDPNASPPDEREARADHHADMEARGLCRPSDPCSSCRAALAERQRTRG